MNCKNQIGYLSPDTDSIQVPKSVRTVGKSVDQMSPCGSKALDDPPPFGQGVLDSCTPRLHAAGHLRGAGHLRHR